MSNSLPTFIESLSESECPSGLTVELQALWLTKKGEWEMAHDLVQDLPSKEAAWVHGYLHWLEGDIWNADYWYRRAGKVRPQNQELAWEEMVANLLNKAR